MKKKITSFKKFPMMNFVFGRQCLFIVTLLSFISVAVSGQITVTPGTGGTNICSNTALDGATPAATTLGDITISENGSSNFGNTGGVWNASTSITLSPPAGWQFNTTTAPTFSIISAAGDLSTVTVGSFTTSSLVISLAGDNNNTVDAFKVIGLSVNAINTTSGGGNITVSALSHVFGTTPINSGALSLTPSAINGTLSVCLNSTTSLSSNTSGGTWSSSNANATIAVNTVGSIFGAVAGTATISYNVGGCFTTNTLTILAQPAINTIGNSGPVCAAKDLTLNNSSTGTGTLLYAWHGPNSFSSPSQNPTISSATTNAGGIYTLTVTDGNGCTKSSTTTAVVNNLPSITTITNTSPTCATTTLTLNATATGVATLQYSWTGPNSFANATQTPTIPTVTTDANGIYSLTVTDGNGCTTSGTTTATVNPLAGTITGNLVICKLLTTTLNCTPAGGTWGSNNPGVASVNAATGVVTGANAGTAQISYTTGCGSSGAVIVTVNPLPAAISGTPAVCLSGTTTLTDADDVGTGTWSSSNGHATIPVSSTGGINGFSAGNSIITFALATGCQTTTTFTVNALPNITSATNNSPVCIGATLSFSATATGAATLHYLWNGPSFYTSTAQNPSIPTVGAGANGVYTLTVTDGNGCVNPSLSTTSAAVNAVPEISSITPDQSSYCSTNSIILTANLTTGTGSVLSYNWSGPAGFSATTAANSKTLTNVSTAAAGIYSVSVTYTGVGCKSPTVVTNPSIVVNTTPTITVTGKSICSGINVDLFLNVTTPSNISWTIGSNPGNNISGFSTSSGGEITDPLVNASNTVANTLQYLVTPVSAVGSCTGVAASVVITVNPTPVMTATTSATTCGALSLPLTASAASNFSWTIGAISPFPTSVTGATASVGSTISQSLANTSNSIPGSVQYVVTPTSTTGSCVGTSETITVTVNPGPALTSQTNVSVCSSLPLTVPLTSSTSSNFNWTVGTASSGISGAHGGSGTSITDNLSNSSNTSYGTQVYNVTPVSSSGGCSGSTAIVTVTVNPLPTVTTSTSQSTCNGVQLNIPLTASIPGSTFTWGESSEQSGISGATSGITNTINDVLTNTSNSTPGKAVYSVRPTSPSTIGSCLSAAPTLINVTVNPTPVMTSTTTVSTCGAVNLLLTSSTAGTTGNTFAWTAGAVTGAAIAGASDGSGNNFIQSLSNPSNSAVGSVQYTVTPTSVTGACPGTSSVLTVSVNPAPSISNGGQSVCSGHQLTINLVSSTSSNFTWTVANTGGMTGGHPSSAPGTTISDILSNSSSTTPGYLVYSVTPTSSVGGCTGASSLITVTVNPSPAVITSTSQASCSGIAMNIGLSASIPGSTFTWGETAESPGISGGTSGTTAITDNLLNSNHTNIGTATYTVLPTSPASIGSCTAAAPTTITISVYPTPVMTSPLIATTCSTVNIPLTASTASTTGSSFAWTVVDPGTTLASSGGSGNNLIQSLTNTSNSAVATVLYSVTPTSIIGSCLGSSSIVTVNVNPSPALLSGGTSICSGSGLSLALNPSTPSNFTWTVESAGSITGGNPGGPGTTITDNLINPSHTTFGTLTYSVTPTSNVGGCSGSSSLLTVTVNPLPVMSASSATVCSGTALNLGLTTTGALASTFLWGENFVSTGTITGYNTNVTSPSITDLLVNSDHNAQGTVVYTVIPTSTAAMGLCQAAATTTITISVNPTPVVTSATNETICSNISPAYTITATTASNYNWGPDAITGSITGAITGTGNVIDQTLFNPSNLTAGSVEYSITPTSTVGCVGVTSFATIGVLAVPLVTTPASASVCNNSQLNVPLSASTLSSFTWSVGTITGAVTGANGGHSDIVDTLYNPSSSSPGTVVYNVVATSTVGNCPSNPEAITVVVNPSPVVTNATSASTCSDVSPNITLTASTASTFAWGANTVSGVINSSTGNNTSLINDLLHNTSNTISGNVTYTITATSDSACTSLVQTTINVVVNPTPVITSAVADTVCSGVPLDINLVASTGPDATFAWGQSSDPGGITGASANSTALINDVLTNPNSALLGVIIYTVLPTSHIGCIPDSTTKIAVVVNPAPQVNVISTSFCGGGNLPNTNPALTYSLTATTGAGTNFEWNMNSETINLNDQSHGLHSFAPVITDTVINSSDTAYGVIIYTVIPTSPAGCIGAVASIPVTINPLPRIAGINDSICSSTSPHINLVSVTSTPSAYMWSFVSAANVIGADTSALGAASSINQILVNTGNTTVGTVVYSVTPYSAAQCWGPPTTFTVSVDPIPRLISTGDTTICSEVPFTYTAHSSSDPSGHTKYTWRVLPRDNNISGLQNFTNLDSTGIITDSVSSSYLLVKDSITYQFILYSRGCVSPAENAIIGINPRPTKPAITISTPDSLCGNTYFQNFGATIPDPTELYIWHVDNGNIFDSITNGANSNILVNFNISQGLSLVTVTANVNGYGCTSHRTDSVFVKSGIADDTVKILYRNGMFIAEKNDVDGMGYQWGYDDSATLAPVTLYGQINQNYYNPAPDTFSKFYWVETTHVGCSQKSYYKSPFLHARHSVTEQEDQYLKMYPNPAQTMINIELGNVIGGDFSADIFDLTGRKLMTTPIKDNVTQLSVADLTPGYYIVECRKNGIKVAVAKFIKN